MRTLRSTVFALIMSVFVLSCSDQPTSPAVDGPQFAARGPLVHHASLGGADVCEAFGLPTGCDANFSLVANEYADGSVGGQWQDSFGHGNGGVHVAVDCLLVFGDQAVVGGVVTKFDADPTLVGTRALTSVVDNGTSADDPADQLSYSFFGFGDPQPFCDTFPPEAYPLFDLTHGQVKVW
jgi:hypothetical protein